MMAVDGKLKRAFSTPLVIEHGGRVQMIAPTAQWIVSYNPATGEEWWRVKTGIGHALVPRPVFSSKDELLYVCTGFGKPELWALRVDGSGEVTDTQVVWTYARQVPEISSPIVVGDHLYFVSTMGVATCLQTSTGKSVWQHRLPGNYAASPLAAGDKLYFTNKQCTTTVLEAGTQYKELARNHLFGESMASSAVWGDSLLIRTAPVLYCVRKTLPSEIPTVLLSDP
jgi:outer membrane protein assembly factor BamB